jgi:PPP family 3-phenylpropionic acid transporter
MSASPQIPTGRAFAWRLAAFYAALFMGLGVQLPFLPVWFAAKGLDATAIGLALAVPMVVRAFAIPLAARQADRHAALRTALVITAAMAALGYGALALAEGLAAVVGAYALASVCYTPIMPLADAYALRGLGRLGRAYGPVRLWGSAAFIAGSFGGGLLLDVVEARNLIWLVVLAVLLTTAAAAGLAPITRAGLDEPPTKSATGTTLLRDPAFLAVVAAASLIQASHAVYYGFSTLAWQAAGLDGGAIGALWALGVVAEIALFAIAGRFSLAPTTLLVLAAVGAVFRWGGMALNPPSLFLPGLQCLHALSFGAAHLGAVGFLAREAPAEIGATAQGYLSVALGLVMAAAMGISGILYARWGGAAYAAMALAAAAGGLCALAAHRLKPEIA